MRDLTCPWCGGMLTIECEYVGPAYLAENRPVAIECDGPLDGFGCGARWDTGGSELDVPFAQRTGSTSGSTADAS